MRAVVITQSRRPYDVLQVQERPDPPPLGPGQVRIDGRAPPASTSPTSWPARASTRTRPPPPCVVGYEVAGTVAEVGRGRRAARGRRPRRGRDPLRRLRRAGRRPASATSSRCPDELSLRAGRGDPRQLRDRVGGAARLRRLRAGERVLIHAAAGGVGIAAHAARQGARAPRSGAPPRPASTTAIRGIGVDHPLDYTRDGWGTGLPPLRPRARRDRRHVVRPLLRAAAPRRAARRLRRLVASSAGEKRNLLHGRPAGAADAARLRPHQADERRRRPSSA